MLKSEYFNNQYRTLFYFVLGSHPAILRNCLTWFSGSLLTVFAGQNGTPRIEPGSIVCKVNVSEPEGSAHQTLSMLYLDLGYL